MDMNIPGYNPPLCSYTESNKGGTIIYVADNINFKPRRDQEIYQSKQLESSFI